MKFKYFQTQNNEMSLLLVLDCLDFVTWCTC